MAKAASSPILRVILQAVEDPHVREASDRDLLQRFSERREAAAFHRATGGFLDREAVNDRLELRSSADNGTLR